MSVLVIKLPKDRDFCGEIRLIGDDGAALAGPFQIAGRAASGPAKAAGNTARSPLLRFGDTPTGRYTIRTILPSGSGTAYRAADFGGNGIIVLDPRGGDAALAEANGRFHIFIQGGASADFIQGGASAEGVLCATNGALRMHDEDLAIVCALLGDADGAECWCVEDGSAQAGTPVADNGYAEGDPPPLVRHSPAGRDVSRRRMLAAGAVAASSTAFSVLLPGIFIAAETASPAQAQNAYDGNNSDNNQNQQSNPDNGNQDNTNQDQQQSPDDNGQNDNQNNDQNNDQNNNNDDNNTPKAY